MSRAAAVACAAVLLACRGSSGGLAGDGGAPTFFADVAPILERTCVRCHDGAGLGPGDYRDPDVVEPLAELLLARIDAGEMPPPAADPECRAYQDAARLTLDPADRDQLARWIDGGKIRGEEGTTPSTAPASTLDSFTHELATAAPFPVTTSGYQCFVLDWDEPDNSWITGFEALIDHAEVTHHLVLFSLEASLAEGFVADPVTRSWPCDAVPGVDFQLLHAWAPGSGAVALPAGGGIEVRGGSALVLQVHYAEGDGAGDSPGYLLDTAPAVDTRIALARIGPTTFEIPAGDASFSAEVEAPMRSFYGGAPVQTTVYSAMAHMHALGSRYDFHATPPTGPEKCVLRAEGYDPANQPVYWFEEPVVLEPDDVLSVACTWDNSAANPAQPDAEVQDVGWGQAIDEEMCYAILYFSAAL